MRLHEYEATDIFERFKIPTSRRQIVDSPEAALLAADEIGYPVMAKAQVLVGGRGLAGGIQSAEGPAELEAIVNGLLGSEIKGMPVEKLMIAARAGVYKELYFGITVDGYAGKPAIVVSTEGGIDIEKTAAVARGSIATTLVEPGETFFPYQARNLWQKAGLDVSLLGACSNVLVQLYRVFTEHNAMIAEINPLVVDPTGKLTAVDAVLDIDDSALFRLKELQALPGARLTNSLEAKGREIGVTYVDLDGDIGLISSGAGLGMASMDIIGEYLTPANFLETGGGITADLMYRCMELVMMKEGLKALFINLYGGINPIHEGAKGIVQYIRDHHPTLPIIAKALGNRQTETWATLRSGGVQVVTSSATETAIEVLLDQVRKPIGFN